MICTEKRLNLNGVKLEKSNGSSWISQKLAALKKFLRKQKLFNFKAPCFEIWILKKVKVGPTH